MKALTVQERILEELRLSSRALDDDELASRLGITPRQTINQACRKLATAGRLRRYPGPEAAQKHKVLSDALKMLYVASTLPTAPRLVICLADPDAAYHFTSASSWAALALKDFGIEVHVVALPAELQASVWQAQKRQYR